MFSNSFIIEEKGKWNIEMQKKPCLKCLLREMDQEAYMENLYDYIAHIEEDIKTPDGKYNNRLEVCKTCDYLQEGMCRACGCYVELRAAIDKNQCPYDKLGKE